MGVHVFTASGAALGLLALERAVARDFSTMFAWLAVALFVDGVDGSLARLARVKDRTPHIDGDMLDLVVDYLTYVVVPLVALWQSGMMPAALGAPVLLVVAVASALYFADTRMKTQDHWFRGFPALWNVVALYLFAFELPGWLVAGVLLGLSIQMFTPLVFVHPMRVAQLRTLTSGVAFLWFGCAAIIVQDGFHGPLAARAGLLAAGLYFVLLPIARRRPGRPAP